MVLTLSCAQIIIIPRYNIVGYGYIIHYRIEGLLVSLQSFCIVIPPTRPRQVTSFAALRCLPPSTQYKIPPPTPDIPTVNASTNNGRENNIQNSWYNNITNAAMLGGTEVVEIWENIHQAATHYCVYTSSIILLWRDICRYMISPHCQWILQPSYIYFIILPSWDSITHSSNDLYIYVLAVLPEVFQAKYLYFQ